ncbi:MAG: ABC transporter permease [Candidatus Microbacterium phytovorans]|uniref:ABC transporter permease n=1 Tax=Candidatus Microbacterium phytovorans TaxID=3121374 RepID=A0AAJ5W048_9MICO|nr:ABC transporter permease [Microbacterium sp.]WEK13449.1 MAG: ABC transporter permease [Microbacterium sp.]
MKILIVLGRRLLWSIPLLFVVSIITFALASLMPGDVASVILGTGATPEQRALITEQLGLDQPLWVQYTSWLGGALQGDLGSSVFSNESVAGMLSSRLPVTLSLAFLTLIACVLLGVLLGALSAIRGGALARILDATSLIAMSIPSFWFAAVMIIVFAVAIPLFPVSGYVPFADSPQLWFASLVLPVFCLATSSVAGLALQMRGQMVATFRSDFVKALRANGISPRSILYRHVLKNAAGPVVTLTGLLVVTLLGGTVFMEKVFGMAGLGTLAVNATARHDLPVIQGVVVYFTLVVIVVNLITDVAYAALNPKVVTS